MSLDLIICEDCGIGDLNSKVDGLVQEIYEEDRDSFEESLVNSDDEEPETEITSEPEPVVESVISSNKPETSKVWHYTAGGITIISALLSYQAASSYIQFFFLLKIKLWVYNFCQLIIV